MKHIKEYEEFVNESKEIELILSNDEDFDRIKKLLRTDKNANDLNFTHWSHGMPLGSAKGKLITMYFANSKEEVEAFINKNSINVANKSNFNLDEELHESLIKDYSNSRNKILVGLKTNLLKDMKDRYEYKEDGKNIHFFNKGNHIATLFDVGTRYQELRHNGTINDYGYIKEDLNATVSDPEIESAWNTVYGKDLKDDYPLIFKIIRQRRAKLDSRELERIWTETHEKSFKEEHSKVWNILFSK